MNLSSQRFTKADVDYLIAARKYIKAIPRTRFLDSARRTGWKIIIPEIFYKADRSKPIKGLVVMAKAHQAPIPLPRPKPSSALEWFGHRIRGLNHEIRHDNPDGTSVLGWHEHLWSPNYDDALVVEAKPEPTQKTLEAILKWGLEKWNIEVENKQGELGD